MAIPEEDADEGQQRRRQYRRTRGEGLEEANQLLQGGWRARWIGCKRADRADSWAAADRADSQAADS